MCSTLWHESPPINWTSITVLEDKSCNLPLDFCFCVCVWMTGLLLLEKKVTATILGKSDS